MRARPIATSLPRSQPLLIKFSSPLEIFKAVLCNEFETDVSTPINGPLASKLIAMRAKTRMPTMNIVQPIPGFLASRLGLLSQPLIRSFTILIPPLLCWIQILNTVYILFSRSYFLFRDQHGQCSGYYLDFHGRLADNISIRLDQHAAFAFDADAVLGAQHGR
jgi:hypothetical protein